MARARNIKPGFFKNEVLAEMPPETRLLFIGLWLLADREGRLEDRPRRIRAEVFPLEMIDAEPMLERLCVDRFIVRYEVGGVRYIQIENFGKHQMPHHKEIQSVIPAPEGKAQITRHSYDVSQKTREAVFARDGACCLKCGTTESLSIDHIKPLGLGGDNSVDNLQTLCSSCNSSKGKTTKDYRKTIIDPMLNQERINDGASCPPDSLIPDSLIPEEHQHHSLNAGEDDSVSGAAVAETYEGLDGADEEPEEEPEQPVDPKAPVEMTLDWKPDAKLLKTYCVHFGVSPDLFTHEATASFTAHHESTGGLNTQAKWVSMLVGWVKSDRVKASNVRQFPAKVTQSRHHGFAERDYTSGLIEREDGTHGF